jgi:hypothetical protein
MQPIFGPASRQSRCAATAKKLFIRVQVKPETMSAGGEPEHVSAGRMAIEKCVGVSDRSERKLDSAGFHAAWLSGPALFA